MGMLSEAWVHRTCHIRTFLEEWERDHPLCDKTMEQVEAAAKAAAIAGRTDPSVFGLDGAERVGVGAFYRELRVERDKAIARAEKAEASGQTFEYVHGAPMPFSIKRCINEGAAEIKVTFDAANKRIAELEAGVTALMANVAERNAEVERLEGVGQMMIDSAHEEVERLKAREVTEEDVEALAEAVMGTMYLPSGRAAFRNNAIQAAIFKFREIMAAKPPAASVTMSTNGIPEPHFEVGQKVLWVAKECNPWEVCGVPEPAVQVRDPEARGIVFWAQAKDLKPLPPEPAEPPAPSMDEEDVRGVERGETNAMRHMR